MTNAEMAKAFSEAGLKAADLKKIEKKVDAEKITKAVETAATLEDGIKAVCKLHPELNANELKKQMDFYAGQISGESSKKSKKKAPMELTVDELEHVAGGSAVGDWFSKNWKVLLVGLAVGITASIGLGFVGAAIGSTAAATGSGMALAINVASASAITTGTMIGSAVGVAVGIGATVGMSLTDNALNS